MQKWVVQNPGNIQMHSNTEWKQQGKNFVSNIFSSSQLSVPTSLHPSPAEVTLSMSIKPLGYLLIPNKIQKTTLVPELTSLGPLGDQNYETGCI